MRILVSVAGAEEDGWLMEGMLYVGSLSYGYGVGRLTEGDRIIYGEGE